MNWLRKPSFWALFALLSFASVNATAQHDASMEELLEKISGEETGFDRSPIARTSLTDVNLKVHWRLWKRVYGAGKPGTDELAALRDDGRSVGWMNQPVQAMAIAALAIGHDDIEVARPMLEAAESLAPQLPYPAFLRASYIAVNDIKAFPEWSRAWWRGVRLAVHWPDTSFPWALKFLVYLLLAFAAASMLFVFGQLLRNFGIVAYDLARIMPPGFSSNQTAVLLVALIIVPALVLRSPIVAVLILLAVVSFVQRAEERWVSILVFSVVASLSFADDALSRFATYPDSLAQQMVNAQWVRCSASCREGMDALAQERPDDPYVRYTALLAAYRAGGEANMKRVVEEVAAVEWPSELSGYAHNLEGSAHVVLAQPKKALGPLETARDELKESAAPVFNLMRAHQMLDDADAAAAALQESTSRDLDAVTLHLRLDRRDNNSFLIVEPIPLLQFWKYHFTSGGVEDQISAIRPIWEVLAGENIPLDATRYIGLAGIALVLLGFPLGRRTSTPCPRCGLARDPTDAQKTGHHVYCFPCYSTFVTGATLDYDARVHNERVLGRRESLQRLMRRMLSVVAPGLGHQIAGRAVAGFAITTSIAFSAALILRPMGVIRVPQELVATNWGGIVTLAWLIASICVFIVLNAALRDIPPTDVGGSG